MPGPAPPVDHAPADQPPVDLIRDAERFLRDGRAEDAIRAYSRALALRPDLPDAWFNLAWLQRTQRRFDDALGSYAQALARGAARPAEARLNRAAILSDHLFRTDEAVAELEAALALDPRFVQAWLNLGVLHEDLGRADAARAAYAAALRLDPGNGRAHARLGAIELFAGRPAAAVDALKAALPRAATLADRAEMLFALGDALDALAEYADAFQAYEAANWLARQAAPARYDRGAHERLVDRIIRAFPEPSPPAPAPSMPGPRPVFVCGMFRSGSTLAERLLGRHPGVFAAGELEFVPALAHSALRPYPEAARALPRARRAELRARYLSELAELRPTAPVVTDKRCDNFLHLGLIDALFPEAPVVHTVRRPLDNVLSIHFLHFGDAVGYGHDLGDAAHHLVQCRRLMAHWRRLFPDRIHDLRYDRLVAEPRAALAPLLDFLGLPWDEACLAPSAADGPVRTASAWAVRRPLHARSSGRWRNYAGRLDEARRILEAAGVDPEGEDP